MESLIVMSLVLAILQIWIIPMVLNMKNMNWLLSNREESDVPSEMLARARRASANLQESLIFAPLQIIEPLNFSFRCLPLPQNHD